MKQILMVLSWLSLGVGSVVAQESLEGDPEIAYWQVGNPTSDRVIVVVHGGPAKSHNYLRPEWDRLGDGARVVFYDQRGCGLSQAAESYGWQDHVSDLKRLISKVSPNVPVVLAGSSWGSLLALYYVAQNPEDVMALVLSGLPERDGRAEGGIDLLPSLNEAGRFGPPRAPNLPSFGSLLRSRNIDDERAQEERLRVLELLEPRFVADCPDVRAATNASHADAPNVWPLGKHGLPMLHFSDNRFGMSINVSARAPEINRNVRTIIGGGHDPWYEHPEVFFIAVKEFLADQWRD